MSYPNNRHGNTPPYLLSAYGIAVKHGYTGTEEEWLASLKGDQGEYPRMQFDSETGYLQIRYDDSGEWTDIASLADLMTESEEAVVASAKEYADLAEAYAKGTVDGEDVEEGDPGYEDNAKYYAGQASTYASAAGGFATGASNYAQAASGYATTASGHADNAAASATAAAGSASDAAGSAASASTSAGSASTSASAAEAQATQAGTYAYNADQSAQAAANYAAAANTAYGAVVDVANGVDVKVEDIETQVSIAAGYATNAGTSATNASGSATAAAGSATAAAGSASAAAASATAAAGSAEDAQEVLDSIPEDYSELSNDVTDLKSAVAISTEIYNDTSINRSIWTVGGYKSDNGKNYANTARLRAKFYPGQYESIKTTTESLLNFQVFCWEADTSTFVGVVRPDGTIAKGTGETKWFSELNFADYNEYIIGIVLFNKYDQTVTLTQEDSDTVYFTNSKTNKNAEISADIKTAIELITNNGFLEFTDPEQSLFIETGNKTIGTVINLTPVYFENGKWSYAIIECSEGDVFTADGFDGGRARLWAFLDAEYHLLAVSSGSQPGVRQIITAPANTAYGIFQRETSDCSIVKNESLYTQVATVKSITGAKLLKGKTWNVLGDSITANASYATQRYFQLISSRQGGITINNYGISGTKIGGQSADAFCNRYSDMAADADIITVFGGVNDYVHEDATPLGQYGDTTNATFYGSMRILCEGLINRYPNALILFITPMQCVYQNSAGHTYTEGNALGYTIYDYADAIIKECGRYAIPVVDLCRDAGFTARIQDQRTIYFVDGLHINQAGHTKVSYLIEQSMINNALGKLS